MPLSDVAVSDVRALVLDDNRNFQQILRTLLRQIGFRQIDLFGEPEAAERHVRGQAIDLAFVDYAMPRLNGLDWIRTVFGGTGPANPDMAVVMVTGHGGRSLVEEAIAAGVDGFLLKPLSPEMLERHVAAVLTRRRGAAAGRMRAPVFERHRIAAAAPVHPVVPVPVPAVPHVRRRAPLRTVPGLDAGARPPVSKDSGVTFLD